MKIYINLIALLFLPLALTFGQAGNYRYNSELSGVTDTWHKIELPVDIFGKTSPSLIDFRIIGSNDNGKRIEMPYIFRELEEKSEEKKVDFKLLNQTRGKAGYYFTFEVSEERSLNHIILDFVQKNYDWKATLEGSQDQKEWFTVIKNERILSIKTPRTKYAYNTLSFPTIQYRYLRVLVKGNEKPFLKSAHIFERVINKGKFYTYKHTTETSEDEHLKSTVIDVAFNAPVPVSKVKINVKKGYDYYRNATIKYLIDSTKIEDEWIFHYRAIAIKTLSSMEDNEFDFRKITTRKLQISIQNLDDQPLTIDSIEVKGYVHEMVARFSGNGPYYMAYGNPLAKKPEYDIARFQANIPEDVKPLKLGKEEIVLPGEKPGEGEQPIFNDEMWLWLLMLAIIIILGGFSLKMIRSVGKKR